MPYETRIPKDLQCTQYDEAEIIATEIAKMLLKGAIVLVETNHIEGEFISNSNKVILIIRPK